MRKLILSFCVLILLAACSSVKYDDLKEQSLFTIDNEPVSAEEFIYVYEKNNFNNDSIYTENDVRDYLDLFINFKLKVKQAKEEGLDTVRSFVTEYESYQSELIKPYLLETKQTDSLAKEAYDRMQHYIHASHILIRVENFDSPEDTLKAYKKILKLRNKIESGESFREVAAIHSEDPSASKNEGDLGYFTALRMVYPFENAAYETPVGGMSEVFRSPFGYHILKVHDKVPNKGKVKIAHIAINKNNNDSVNARNKAFEIYDRLMTGGDWDYLCLQYSEDDRTKGNGGELNFISQGQLPKEYGSFEEVAFSLDTAGQIGGPVETPFGWHIIKLLEKQELASYDELKDQLKRQIARGERAKINQKIVLRRLKDQSGFEEDSILLNYLSDLYDEEKSKWADFVADSLMIRDLFEIDGVGYPVKLFVKFAKENPPKRTGRETYESMMDQYQNFVEEKLFKYEESRIAHDNIEYRMLSKEYFEGLLLFEIMEKNVWSKPGNDTVALKNYFNDHKERYRWKKRADVVIVSYEDSTLENVIEEDLIKDSINYFSTELSAREKDITEKLNAAINSVYSEFVKVPESKLLIRYSPEAISEDFYKVIIDKLNSLNIDSDDILTSVAGDKDYTIKFSLISPSGKVLEYLYNKNSALTLKVQEGIFEKGENELLKEIEWSEGIHSIDTGSNHYLIKIGRILPEENKELDEIRGRVISDYQEYIEKEWISSLKAKYTVNTNEEVLNKTIKYFENK